MGVTLQHASESPFWGNRHRPHGLHQAEAFASTASRCRCATPFISAASHHQPQGRGASHRGDGLPGAREVSSEAGNQAGLMVPQFNCDCSKANSCSGINLRNLANI